jgi:prevent-host-death family protein
MGEISMAKTLPLSEVKTRLPELVAGVDEREEEIVVTKNGRPAAILINVREYESLKATLEVLSDLGGDEANPREPGVLCFGKERSKLRRGFR